MLVLDNENLDCLDGHEISSKSPQINKTMTNNCHPYSAYSMPWYEAGYHGLPINSIKFLETQVCLGWTELESQNSEFQQVHDLVTLSNLLDMILHHLRDTLLSISRNGFIRIAVGEACHGDAIGIYVGEIQR